MSIVKTSFFLVYLSFGSYFYCVFRRFRESDKTKLNYLTISTILESLTKVIAYIFTFLITAVAICFVLVLYIGTIPQETIAAVPVKIIDVPKKLTKQQGKGQVLFKANCSSCHKLFKRSTGPELLGISEKYEREWLYSWIKNSQELISSGDVQAMRIYNEYKQTNMNSFPQLSNEDIDDILAYTNAYQ